MSLRMGLTTSILIGALLPLFSGCANGAAASECPEVRQPVAPAALPSSAPASSAVPQPSASTPVSASASAPVSSSPAIVPGDSANSPTAAASTGSPLPELKVHLSGMHIGGGPNDEGSKRPFIQAIEDAYGPLRACYRKAEDPMHGGTFGVDLKIAGRGGVPEIQQVRTALKGEGLRECLTTVFKGIQFAPPPKGPTIVSVSVRFSLGS